MKEQKTQKYLTFEIGERCYGIEIECVREVVGRLPITKISDYPDCVKGVINVRGHTIPVVDLKKRIEGLGEGESDCSTMVVIERKYNEALISIAFIVDKVLNVEVFKDSVIQSVSIPGVKPEKGYLHGVVQENDQEVFIFEVNYLLSAEEHEELASPLN